jgi:hypothetical protein
MFILLFLNKSCDAGAAARARQVLFVPCLVVYATWAYVGPSTHVMLNVHTINVKPMYLWKCGCAAPEYREELHGAVSLVQEQSIS